MLIRRLTDKAATERPTAIPTATIPSHDTALFDPNTKTFATAAPEIPDTNTATIKALNVLGPEKNFGNSQAYVAITTATPATIRAISTAANFAHGLDGMLKPPQYLCTPIRSGEVR
jgi:hypothetical protein